MTDELIFNNKLGREISILSKGISGQEFKALFEAGMTWLRTNHQYVNSLNVFPVPDGDTGTNMLLTMQAAFNEVTHSGEQNIGKIAHDLSKGALLGARGNSGVILSQIWRGFARGLDSYESMNAQQLVQALIEARNTAYKGVVRPVEGTILTVIKDIAAAAEVEIQNSDDLKNLLEKIVAAADISVRNTPELLPVLKQAGVVDSGGKGLFFIFDGFLRYLNNQPLDTAVTTVQSLSALSMEQTIETIEPGQDYEIVVDFRPYKPLNLEEFYSRLSDIGTSIQIGEGDNMYRMHIHVPTDRRYDPIDYTMSLGTITKVNIENLMDQMQIGASKPEDELKFSPVEDGNIAVIAVTPGVGIARIFASLGVSGVVNGGQTMNPSTEEILHSFENLPTDKVIVLPNNKNIIMAAQTAVSMTVKKVAIIPSKNVPQGLSAMLRFIPDGDFDRNVEEMNEALNDVDTCEITTATRSVELNGVDVKEGSVIGLLNGKLVASSDDLQKTCLDVLEQAKVEERERITFFYGNNISEEKVNEIIEKVQEKYPKHELEIHSGGQPHYQFIIAVE
jgi:DAK2 domain fusion protein YloV